MSELDGILRGELSDKEKPAKEPDLISSHEQGQSIKTEPGSAEGEKDPSTRNFLRMALHK